MKQIVGAGVTLLMTRMAGGSILPGHQEPKPPSGEDFARLVGTVQMQASQIKNLQADVKDLQDWASPIGTIAAFGGDLAEIPNTWFLCDGRNLKRTDYPLLANKMKGAWGE